jgi:hypothetical protein
LTEWNTASLEDHSKLIVSTFSSDLFTNHSVPPEIATVWSGAKGTNVLSKSVKTAGSKTTMEWPPLTSNRNIKRTSVLALTKAHQDLSPSNKKLQAPPAMIRRADGEGLLELLKTKKMSSRANTTANTPAKEISVLSNWHTTRPTSKLIESLDENQKGSSLSASQVSTLNYSAVTRSNIPPGFDRVTKSSNSSNIKQRLPFSTNTNEASLFRQNNLQSCARVTCMTLEEYSRMLRGMSESTEPETAERAEAMLRNISRMYEVGEHDIRPDGSCYNRYVMGSYIQIFKSRDDDSHVLIVFDYSSYLGTVSFTPTLRLACPARPKQSFVSWSKTFTAETS